jgi:hypothetical protein
MFEINLFITTFRLLMIDSNDYLPWPPSEIRQRPIGLAEERRRNGVYRGGTPISFLIHTKTMSFKTVLIVSVSKDMFLKKK